jgi:hypothetical protein
MASIIFCASEGVSPCLTYLVLHFGLRSSVYTSESLIGCIVYVPAKLKLLFTVLQLQVPDDDR